VRAVLAVLLSALLLGVVAATWPSTLGGSVTYISVNGISMEPGMRTGDLAVVREASSYRTGDIVAFDTEDGRVIHRIVGGDANTGFRMQGDNRDTEDPWRPTPEHVVGRLWIHLPMVGAAVLWLQTPVGLGVVAAVLAVLLSNTRLRPRRRRPIRIARTLT
jgi:signal peptidase I